MKVKAIVVIAVALLMAVFSAPVCAAEPPPLPHAFYGSLTVNDSPAPVGTQVEARGEGVRTGIEGNPIVTTEVGKYGSADPLGAKLVVQGDIADGATITFYVEGESTGQTAEWHSGETTELDLSVTLPTPPAGGGGGGGAPPAVTTVTTTIFGATVSFSISDTGEIQSTFTATSADGNLTITIPEGTIALDEDGNPLSSLTGDVDPSPPSPPEDSYIIGLAYDFGPPGATFDPAITFEYTYDPAEIPEGAAEGDLVMAYYDEAAGEWVELPSTVDPATDTITASVSHFTTFALIATVAPPAPPPPAAAAFKASNLSIKPAEVQPGEVVTVTVSVANTGGREGSYSVVLKINGVKEAEKSVTLAASKTESVSFSVSREEAGDYSVAVDGLVGSFRVAAPAAPPPAKAPINWPLVGGIIGGVIVVGLLIFFLARRRAY